MDQKKNQIGNYMCERSTEKPNRELHAPNSRSKHGEVRATTSVSRSATTSVKAFVGTCVCGRNDKVVQRT